MKNTKQNGAFCWFMHRVSYGETDVMGYMYYGEYLHVFERARTELIRTRGMSYADIEKKGIMLPVREAHVRYRVPLHYDAVLQIKVWVEKIGRASICFAYEVYDETKKKLHATAYTEHACASTTNGKPVAMPDWMQGLLIPEA